MLIVSPWLARRGAFICCLVLGPLHLGCKRHAPEPAPAPTLAVSAVGSALPEPEETTHCRRRPDFSMTLEAEAPPAGKPSIVGKNEDEDDDALLPFGVDIGMARPTPFGFAVAGMRGAGQAFVALLGEHASQRVDLGELHGDAETPGLAVLGQRVLVALRSSDAAGFTLKLGSVAGPEASVAEWGYELSKLGKTVTGVELAATGARGVLVYQGEEKSGGSRLMLGTFSTENLKQPFEVKPLEPKDAEMPHLLARAGGFWLSWVRTLPEPKKVPQQPPPDAGPPQDPEERELLDVGLRVVEVAKLDEQGKSMGAAKRVGEPRRQVFLYDVAALASGGLLVAIRSDSAAPGAEGGALLLSEVGPDGSVREEKLDDDEIGAGAPLLLSDSDPKLPGPWLAVSAPNDATRIGLAQGGRSVLQADPLLGHAEVVAVSAGHFLLQRARGRGVVLETVDCSWPSSDGAAEKK